MDGLALGAKKVLGTKPQKSSQAPSQSPSPTSSPVPVPAPNAGNPEFWPDMHQIAEQFQREEQPLHQRQASLRSIAYNAGVSLNDRQIRWLDKEAERAIHDWKDGYDATEAIRVPRTKWLWDGIFLLGVVNLLIAREKVGKTSLIIYLLC